MRITMKILMMNSKIPTKSSITAAPNHLPAVTFGGLQSVSG